MTSHPLLTHGHERGVVLLFLSSLDTSTRWLRKAADNLLIISSTDVAVRLLYFTHNRMLGASKRKVRLTLFYGYLLGINSDV